MREFAEWLFERALAKPNIEVLLEERYEKQINKPTGREGRTNQVSVEKRTNELERTQSSYNRHTREKKLTCYRCGGEHILVICPEFKKDPVKTRKYLIKNQNLCEICLKGKHPTEECRTQRSCPVDGCKTLHHELLHEEDSKAKFSVYHTKGLEQGGFLNIIAVKTETKDRKKQMQLNVLLDGGSDVTLLRETLVKSLGLNGVSEEITVATATGGKKTIPSMKVQLEQINNEGEKFPVTAWTVPKVCDPIPKNDWGDGKLKWTHLEDLPLQSSGGRIDLLQGTDHIDLIVAREARICQEFELCAARTRLGWMVNGRKGPSRMKHCFLTSEETEEKQIDQMLSQFFATENFEAERKEKFLTRDEKTAVHLVKSKTKKLEIGYEIGLPWKEGEPNLENNRTMAEARIRSLFQRFANEPDLERDYENAIQKYITQGHASRVVDETEGSTFYLPHHGVYKNTPGTKKLRVVFNAAAPFNGKCLNDTLYVGPAWLNQLPQVIIKFRERKIAFTADIEAMFSRIRLTPEDARYHRFLWREKSTGHQVTYQMDRLTFGDCCSPFIAVPPER